MAALLVGLSVMSVLMSMALPVWSHMMKREKEEELIWRGNQYARAIMLFQRKFANTFPPSVDVLVDQKFLRKKYKDPITNDDFVLLPPMTAMMPGQAPGQGPGQPPMQQPGGRPPTQQSGFGPTSPQSGFGPTSPQSGFGQRPAPTSGGGMQMQTPGQTLNLGIGGVASKSTETSIRIYNGRQKYNEWAFVAIQTAQRIGVPGGGQFPGTPMQPGIGGQQQQPGMPPGAGSRSGRPPVPFGPGGQQPFGQPPFGQPPTQPFSPPGQPGRPSFPRPPGS
jgi:type II secretory pathway pseudopilin PulG